ncbi:glycosyltransferase [Cellulosimicrobium cellulans]|uniref:glycosyltransferase n=1 Tax=Cellulosimicrobium cellulans TaxID=1710 RepID=UPI0014775C86|nr:glycosyltransferase [Cellulosimicrobium cellulans]
MPDLSVVIAAFDAQDTLDEQLDALAGQDVGFAFEVLVCDNGSRDATADLVRRRQEREPWLRLVDASARRGPSAARNIGAGQARGRFLAFCDADDVVGQGWLAGMHDALQHDEFVTGSWEGDRLNSGDGTAVSWMVESVYRLDFFPWLPATGAGTMGIRRAVFEEAGGFDERLATNEDTDLSWRVQLAGHRLVHHPEIVLHVRKRDGLRAIFRQAYAYGAGDRLLRHRYADVAAAYQRREDQPSRTAAPARERSEAGTDAVAGRAARAIGAARRVLGKVAQVRSRRDLADRVQRVGHDLGFRFAGSDAAVERVPVPPVLPDPS